MKKIFFNLTFLLITYLGNIDIVAQNMTVRESSQNNGDLFYKIISGRAISKVNISLKTPKYIIYWGSDGKNVYCCDGNNIYVLDFIKNKPSIIYTSKQWINNFFVRNSHIYFTVTSAPQVDENEGRYIMKKHKIIVFDCGKKSILKQIIIPFNCNVSGLSVSPDEQKVIFVNTLDIDKPKKTSYELVGFSITERQKEKYDQAYYKKNQWFMESHTYNCVYWSDNDSFFYLKKLGRGQNKGVYKYIFKNRATINIIPQLPQRDINWFIWNDNSVLYSNRKDIISFDGQKQKIIYTHNSSIIEGM
jgi:hypothetical protein